MIRQKDIGLGIVVLNHSSVNADDRNAQSLNVVREHVSVKQAVVLDAIISQGLHHLIVVHLKARVQNVDLVILLALVLIHAETSGK